MTAPAIQTGRRELSQKFDRLRAVLADVERTNPELAPGLYASCAQVVDEMAQRVVSASNPKDGGR